MIEYSLKVESRIFKTENSAIGSCIVLRMVAVPHWADVRRGCAQMSVVVLGGRSCEFTDWAFHVLGSEQRFGHWAAKDVVL